MQYAERDEYAFADTIFRLTKGGYLNATSTGWIPLAWAAANDRARPGGLNFSRVELLEISQVPVPALPTALVTARAAGIDTQPLFDWAERMLDAGGFVLIPRAELEQIRKEAKMPTSRANPPQEPAAAPEPAASEPPVRIQIGARGLWMVAWLASLLDDLGCVQEMVEWEAQIEEDGSAVPAQLKDALKQLGQVLVDMTVEEVAELFAGDEQPEAAEGGEVMTMSAGVPGARAAIRALRGVNPIVGASMSNIFRHCAKGGVFRFALDPAAPLTPLTREGKRLSKELRGAASNRPATTPATRWPASKRFWPKKMAKALNCRTKPPTQKPARCAPERPGR